MDVWKFSYATRFAAVNQLLVFLRLEPADYADPNTRGYPQTGNHSIVCTCIIHRANDIADTQAEIISVKATNHGDMYYIELPTIYQEFENLVFISNPTTQENAVAVAISGIRDALDRAVAVSAEPIPFEYLPASFELEHIIDPDTQEIPNEIDDELKPLVRVVFRDIYRQFVDGFCTVDGAESSNSYVLK
jgi:hypothetical protein